MRHPRRRGQREVSRRAETILGDPQEDLRQQGSAVEWILSRNGDSLVVGHLCYIKGKRIIESCQGEDTSHGAL